MNHQHDVIGLGYLGLYRCADCLDVVFESLVRIGPNALDGPAMLRFDAGGLGAVSVRVVVKAGGGGLPL